jgi:hypothetical protein
LADLGLPFLLPFCHDPNFNGICSGRIPFDPKSFCPKPFCPNPSFAITNYSIEQYSTPYKNALLLRERLKSQKTTISSVVA